MAEAPVPILFAATAALDGVAYFSVPDSSGAGSALLGYALSDDRWEELPLPATLSPHGFQLTATPDRLLASDGSEEAGTGRDVVSFDPASRTWSSLPPDPLPPLFGRSLVWSGSELVLLGAEIVPNPNSERPSLSLAAAFAPESSTWRRLPDSEILLSGPWVSTAGQLVSPWFGGADGGEVNNWGRSYPFGGILDARTGRWSSLPAAPAIAPGHAGSVPVAGDGYVGAAEGFVLDVTRSAWIRLPAIEDQPSEGQAAAWAAGRLVVFGGARFDPGPNLSGDTWTWVPPASGG